nr:MAG TPA: ERF superfamily protein [Caudoviricetes sp.]
MEEKKKMSIYETIPAVMAEIGAIGKDSWNKQGQGFAYRGIDAVMNALSPAMTKYKMFVIPKTLDQRREERQTAKGSTLIYSICTVEYTFYAEDGSSVSATVIGEGMDSGDKATNKAMSAAFKYACFQTFCIPTEEMKDPDAETPPPSKPAKPTLEAKYVNTLFAELQRTGIGLKGILQTYKVADVHDLTFEDWKKAMDILKGKPDKPAPEVPDKADEGLPWN